MTLIIEQSDPHHPQATALLRASHALMQELFPAESNHFLSIENLCAPNITFLTARQKDQIIGTGALANQRDYGEIKSMFTDPSARGKGVADAILRAIEDHAKDQNLPALRLETGVGLDAAHRLYARHGFAHCGPFGDYTDDPLSVFMQKEIS